MRTLTSSWCGVVYARMRLSCSRLECDHFLLCCVVILLTYDNTARAACPSEEVQILDALFSHSRRFVVVPGITRRTDHPTTHACAPSACPRARASHSSTTPHGSCASMYHMHMMYDVLTMRYTCRKLRCCFRVAIPSPHHPQPLEPPTPQIRRAARSCSPQHHSIV